MDPSPSDGLRRNSPQPASAQRPKIVGSHASSADAGTATTAAPIPDEDHGVDLPLTMAASVVLTGLPQDAHRALADAEAIDTGKGMYSIFFNSPLVGSCTLRWTITCILSYLLSPNSSYCLAH